MNNTEETTTVETSTEEEAAPDQTRPRKKTAARKQREPRKGRAPRKRRQRGIEPATKKITTAAAESRKKSRSRDGSKAEVVLELLRRKDGATTAEIAKATGWQNHTIRAFVSAHVGKKMGLAIESAKNEAGERFYRIIP